MRKLLLTVFFAFLLNDSFAGIGKLEFVIRPGEGMHEKISSKGRLFILFSKEKPDGIFKGLQYPDLSGSNVFGVDISGWRKKSALSVSSGFLGFPTDNIQNIQPGKWYIHAVYVVEKNLPNIDEAGNYYTDAKLVEIANTSGKQTVRLTLNHETVDKERVPGSDPVNYIKIKSQLLSDFWKRPMYLNAQVILPKDYNKDSNKKYPVLFLIGGFGGRYYENVLSKEDWSSPEMPPMIIVALDSRAPFGDSYQTNSANNGPYGDATVYELIPHIEKQFPCIGKPEARFLTGTSTGGWASLALQVFYPDFFNGVWSTCADPVDFSAMELVNIYENKNVFINPYGVERPAMRSSNGEPRYTLRTSIHAENMLGYGNSYLYSGAQWGSWNAVFSPKDTITGMPMALFDARDGNINKNVAEQWKKYDLRFYLANHWDSIGSKIQGKLHIWMGTNDSYYLNNAMELLDNFLKSTTNPKSDAAITFECGEGHACAAGLRLPDLMNQMMKRMNSKLN
jgi:hypothetical protein